MANKVVERHTGIAVNLTELDRVLLDAADRSAQARELIQTGNSDGAIGALLDMEGALARIIHERRDEAHALVERARWSAFDAF